MYSKLALNVITLTLNISCHLKCRALQSIRGESQPGCSVKVYLKLFIQRRKKLSNCKDLLLVPRGLGIDCEDALLGEVPPLGPLPRRNHEGQGGQLGGDLRGGEVVELDLVLHENPLGVHGHVVRVAQGLGQFP